MRHYELVTILSPMLNQDDASATWDEIKSFITNREGELTAEQTWGTRRLAYPIRKGNYNFLEGSYYLTSFTTESPINRELETYLRLHDNVLRALVTRCEGPLEDKPAPGPLTAPSRYVPPGRGRRNDGGGPIPEAASGFAERGGPPAAPPAPATAPAEGAAPAAATEATPAPAESPATPAEATPAEASAATPTAEPVSEAPPAEASAATPTAEPASEAPAAAAPAAETASESAPEPAAEPAGETGNEAEA